MDMWTLDDELNLESLNVARALLLMAQSIAYPDLKTPAYMAKLGDLARKARDFIPNEETSKRQSIRLAEFLFIREAFTGNKDNYDDPRNSYLNELLERRLGIPISLSILYVEIAQRLNIKAFGVGLPGHFIVQIHDDGDTWYIDPFYGGRQLSESDCALLVRKTTGYDGPFNPAWLAPSPPLDILARVLNNLRINYVERRNWEKALAVVRLLRLIQPAVPEHVRDLGLLYYRLDSFRLAAHYLENYLLRMPEAKDAEMIRQGLSTSLDDWARMN